MIPDPTGQGKVTPNAIVFYHGNANLDELVAYFPSSHELTSTP